MSPPSMLGIRDLLNEGSSPELVSHSSDDGSRFTSHVGSEPKLEVNSCNHRIDKLYRTRVHPAFLKHHRLLDIALRRKLAPKRTPSAANCGLKLHRKLLEAGLRVRLISAPSIYEIYYQLTPLTSHSKQLYRILADKTQYTLRAEDVSLDLVSMRSGPGGPRQSGLVKTETGSVKTETGPAKTEPGPGSPNSSPPSAHAGPPAEMLQPGKLTARTVRLIDSNLVNLAGVPSKVLKSLTYDKSTTELGGSVSDRPEELVRTFNNLDTAVSSMFAAQKYSLVRVTKCAASNSEASALVKLETAQPGDPSLIDDGEFIEDMVASLGQPDLVPSNLFIKKVIARPRYKVDMKLYFVPTGTPMLLYVVSRAFERDLINGIIDIQSTPDRHICTTFDPAPILDTVRRLVWQSTGYRAAFDEHVPNHITENLHKYFMDLPAEQDSEDSSQTSSTPASRSSMFSLSNDSIDSSGFSLISSASSVAGK
ncbi:hypothetical protein METBIDRAFT_33430 [Metschnikowia bicuspidata var. bicuspidata NRRL YB-4993]|uniref:Uncharacterized protein n=1 Tax=Metschnikowia bicuspidata var. bicuspidata NRRL YB-4993 TaxID=869754 RepID=A0A1A0H5P0_9ASCO|nr:hypothetical protein METBIDRAFT_33430 [Metschnikowia bicuspidata var. bicuspidata NRRL YB-4993]OBA19222.1 hypothetical protein METBIDRAFT_33430 [Metschnikowia bicuspidata var. bicuspidata NRRL YB-4993]